MHLADTKLLKDVITCEVKIDHLYDVLFDFHTRNDNPHNPKDPLTI